MAEGLRGLKEERLERAARSYTSAAGVGCDGFHPKVLVDLSQEMRRNGEVLREGGAVWEMAATTLHDDFLVDSEELHEPKPQCTFSHLDSVVGVVACVCHRKKGIVLGGMPLNGRNPGG